MTSVAAKLSEIDEINQLLGTSSQFRTTIMKCLANGTNWHDLTFRSLKERNEWIHELRTTRIKQGSFHLFVVHEDQQYACCLGIKCLLDDLEHWLFDNERRHIFIFDDEDPDDENEENCDIWSDDYARKVFTGPAEDFANLLSILNDSGITFGAIADFLESIPAHGD